MTAREHAEKASEHLKLAEPLPLGDGALPVLLGAAQAHALTALALEATNVSRDARGFPVVATTEAVT